MSFHRYLTNLSKKIAVVIMFVVIFCTISHAQERPASKIKIESYSIVILELTKPIMRVNVKGEKQEYKRAYLVELKGDFPIDRAQAAELYIGDYKIQEYGGTRDGVYFKLYDFKLIEQLEDNKFRYRFKTKEIQDTNIRFSLKKFKPLKILQEKKWIENKRSLKIKKD